MAGFTRAYFIGGEGGFMGADGVNPLQVEILEGHSDRVWFEPVYVDASLEPLGSLRVVVPSSPDDPNAVLDACLAFFPAAFERCPSLSVVRSQLGTLDRLDFDARSDKVPEAWANLRAEAQPTFRGLNIWRCNLIKMDQTDGE